MAINYEQVGWDTSKYVNPTRMNHMDDGIKAACDKVDAHDQQIDTINSNFENIISIKYIDTSVTIDANTSIMKTIDFTEEMKQYRIKQISEVEPRGGNFYACEILQANSSDAIYLRVHNGSSSQQTFNIRIEMLCIYPV